MATRIRRRESFLPDPTLEEIRRETAAIRQTWSPRELERRCYYRATPWLPPVLMARELPDAIAEEGAA
jgi:hypothetical protein